MTSFLKQILALCCLLICTLHLCAAAESRTFKRVISLDNLPQKDVQCLLKDRKGFIWIGTLDGLHRYDGYDFRSYYVTKNKNSISSNMILSLDEDTLGNIWISTYGEGVNKLDPRTGHFHHYSLSELGTPLDNTNLLVDKTNTLWLSSWDGLKRVRFDDTMTRIKSTTSAFESRVSTRALCLDDEDNLWVGAVDRTYLIKDKYADIITCDTFRQGCFALNQYKGNILHGKTKIRTIHPCNDSTNTNGYCLDIISEFDKKKPRYIFKILETKNSVWAGTRKGLWQYKYLNDGQLTLVNIYDQNSSHNSIPSNTVRALIEDNNQNIWVGTRGGGLSIVKDNPKQFEHFTHTEKIGSLSDPAAKCIFIDSKNELWMGTEAGGVNRISVASPANYKNGFKSYTINTQKTANRVYAIEEIQTPHSTQQERLLFMGTSHPVELATINPLTQEIKNVAIPEKNFGFVFALEAQNDSTLWVGTYYNGLWRLSLNHDGEVIRTRQFTPDNDNSTISSYIIRNIYYDTRGNLWVSSDKGLNVVSAEELKQENPTFTQYNTTNTLPFNYILQIFEAKDGTIWLGSMGGGLIQAKGHDVSQLNFEQYTTQSCLVNNTIKGIQEDSDGNLWLSSNQGLSLFTPSTSCCVNYDINDGLQDNEFSEICSGKLPNGQLMFGGKNGFNVFYPHQIKKDTLAPKLFLSDFYLFNKQVKAGDTINGRILLDQEMEYKQKLKLKYFENNFSIGFVGLQYNSPQKNQYKYMLVGYDKDWVTTSSEARIAKYTNLDAGEYTFMMTAANCDGFWSNEILKLQISITPPLWERWYFKGSIIALILLIIILYVRQRVSYLRKQKIILKKKIEQRTQELQQANKELEESNATKDKFFSIVAHDLRSPVNGFLGLTKLMDSNFESLEAQKMKHFVHLLAKSANSMFTLLENLLHWARLQQNRYIFSPKELKLKEVLTETLNGAQELASKKDITLKVNIADDLNVFNDDFVINMVVRNLLSNAIKFTSEGGQVEVAATLDSTQVIVSIKDNGIGMNPEIRNDLFDLNKDTHRIGTNKEPSSGLGLVLCKEFIGKTGGKLWIESEEGKGSTFYFSSATA